MADSNPPRKGGLEEQASFPSHMHQQGKTRSGKLVLEKDYTTPGFDAGSSGHLTPENITDGIEKRDTPHPATGEDIFGEY